MKERTPQDLEWVEQKKESGRINRLLLDGFFYKGEFHKKLIPLKAILRRINREPYGKT